MPNQPQAEPLTPQEWHAWFSTQAEWTRATRLWLYRQAGLARAASILEVGCGSGVITREMASLSEGRVVGLDLDPDMVRFARRQDGAVDYVRGDAHALPFEEASCEIAVCHYLLLWLADPARAVREMARVVRPGGRVLACAEPDYGGRIDHPPPLSELGRLQRQALRRQGAEPLMGRRLGELFAAAGLQATVGIVPGRWKVPGEADAEFEAEWAMREHDLRGIVPHEKLRSLRALDRRALQEGRRTLFVPTFYAVGEKPAQG